MLSYISLKKHCNMIYHLSTGFSSSVVHGISQLEALVTSSFFCYLVKTAFLMAITSAGRIRESSTLNGFLEGFFEPNIILMLPFSYWNNISACENRSLTWYYEASALSYSNLNT